MLSSWLGVLLERVHEDLNITTEFRDGLARNKYHDGDKAYVSVLIEINMI